MELVTEKPACAKCGAEVREGTAFCYACGERVAQPVAESVDPDKTLVMTSNGTAADVQPAETGPATPEGNAAPAEDKLSKAREQRRKARVSQRKPIEYTWEPASDARWLILSTIVIAIFVALVVGAMVYWK